MVMCDSCVTKFEKIVCECCGKEMFTQKVIEQSEFAKIKAAPQLQSVANINPVPLHEPTDYKQAAQEQAVRLAKADDEQRRQNAKAINNEKDIAETVEAFQKRVAERQKKGRFFGKKQKEDDPEVREEYE